jgi:hypothetical protein
MATLLLQRVAPVAVRSGVVLSVVMVTEAVAEPEELVAVTV